jgi:hypothetical protein
MRVEPPAGLRIHPRRRVPAPCGLTATLAAWAGTRPAPTHRRCGMDQFRLGLSGMTQGHRCANGGVSHSEGQGWGFSPPSDDRATSTNPRMDATGLRRPTILHAWRFVRRIAPARSQQRGCSDIFIATACRRGANGAGHLHAVGGRITLHPCRFCAPDRSRTGPHSAGFEMSRDVEPVLLCVPDDREL